MIDAAERGLFEESVRTAFARAGGERGAPVDGALAELGWLELLAAEPADAVDIVFRALGSAHATSSALEDVVASALGRGARADVAVLLPPSGASDPPGRTVGGRFRATGLATARLDTAREVLVAVATEDGTNLALVATADARAAPVRGIDPEADLRAVTIDVDPSLVRALDVVDWEAGVALGRRAIGSQVAGACRAMLDLARRHALEREQFGRPIAQFQAVRGRLADALVACEALDAALAAACDEPGSATAALAKAVAGRTARTVGAQCQQVLAGIGFTTEHAFHRYLKRTMLLDGLFGTADAIVLSWGRQLLDAGRVPRLIEL